MSHLYLRLLGKLTNRSMLGLHKGIDKNRKQQLKLYC